MTRQRNASRRASSGLKLLDRYLGIPLVFALGVFRRKRKDISCFSSLGLLEMAAIGDTVLLAGVASDLRRAFPDKRIIFFAGPSNYEVAHLLEGLDEVVELPVDNPIRAIRLLREKRVDVLCDFGPWPRISALYSLFSGAGRTIGFRTTEQYRHYVYDRVVEHGAAVHEIENYRSLVTTLGVASTSVPAIRATVPLIDGLWSEPYVVFHPWSGGYKGYLKEWPDKYWIDLAEKVAGLGFNIVLTGATYDFQQTEALRGRIDPRRRSGIRNLAGKISLAQTATVLRDAAAVVTVNTGIMHLAAAVGAAVLALNGPVSATRWGPLGERSVSVDPEAAGCGYLNLGFEYENQREDCMTLIKPERVFSVLRQLLESAAAGSVRAYAHSRQEGR